MSRSEKCGVVVIVRGEVDDELVQNVWEANDDSSRRLQYLTSPGTSDGGHCWQGTGLSMITTAVDGGS
jgi:hypothetical protein